MPNRPQLIDTLALTALRESTDSTDQPDGLPVSYRVSIEPLHNQKLVRLVFRFASPENLLDVEAFHFTLPYAEAGIFARKIELARKKIR